MKMKNLWLQMPLIRRVTDWEKAYVNHIYGRHIACQCRRLRFNPWVRKIPWRRKWQPTPVFLPGKFHGLRSLVGYSSWDHRVRHDWATKQQFFAVGNGNWHSHSGKGCDSLLKNQTYTREAWHAAVHGVTKSRTQLSNLTTKTNC